VKHPKLWRKKRGGRLVGSFHATIAGKDVNLGTSDAEEATARLRAAIKKGKRTFPDELAEAAAAVDGVPEAPPAAPPPLATPPDPQAQPIVPDAVIPPQRQLPPVGSAEDARAEAEATNAAAADVDGQAANDNAGGEGAAPPFPPEFLDQMLATGALVIVDLQLQLQAYAIKRGLKVQAGPIAPDNVFRQQASQAWAAQLKTWFPSVSALPPWGAALLLPLACVPAQLEGSTPLPDEETKEKPADPPAQEAA
jgi:hypothetical protein